MMTTQGPSIRFSVSTPTLSSIKRFDYPDKHVSVERGAMFRPRSGAEPNNVFSDVNRKEISFPLDFNLLVTLYMSTSEIQGTDRCGAILIHVPNMASMLSKRLKRISLCNKDRNDHE